LLPESGTAEIRTRDLLSRNSNALTNSRNQHHNRVISTWNNLPDMVVHSPTLPTFKRHHSVLDLSCHS